MSLSFSQLASYLLLPPFSLLCLAFAGWLLQRRRPRLGKLTVRTALALLLFISTRFGANLLLAPLEDGFPPADPALAAGAQAIVILTSGALPQAPEYGNHDAPDGLALARMRYGAHLQHQTGLPVLVTGGRTDPARQAQSLAASMAEALRTDFRTDVKWVEEQAMTTADNANKTAAILLPAGVRRVVLVTHAMHMRRAELVFRAAGFDVVPAPTAFYARLSFDPQQLLPSASALMVSYYAFHEWIGLAWYSIKLQAVRLRAPSSAAAGACNAPLPGGGVMVRSSLCSLIAFLF